MRPLVALCSLLTSAFLHICHRKHEPTLPAGGLIVRTVDGFGHPIQSTLVYELRDCEYDFLEPSRVTTNKQGIALLSVGEEDYVQFYAEGYLHESYHCFGPTNRPSSVTVYAAPIPTYVKTSPFAHIQYFENTSGNCDWEATQGTLVRADHRGKATLYLPPQAIYKIQVDSMAQCFQPDQSVHTLIF